MIRSPADYRFAWRDGNRFELLVDGESFFGRMLSAIDAAHSSVLLELYLFQSGRLSDIFIQTLARAVRRGVAVKLLLDGWGARGLANADRERMRRSGIELAIHNALHYSKGRSNLRRDHRKLLLVDGKIGFVGGAGVADAFDAESEAGRHWHEMMVEVRGPVLVDWHALFEETWCEHARGSLGVGPPVISKSAGSRGRVVATGGARSNDLRRSVYWRVRRARYRVWLATAYFVPSWKLRRALVKAAAKGVDVRLLLPGPRTDLPSVRFAGRGIYARLLRHGVRIFEYQPRFTHAKVLLCDDWVSLGSSNLDRWNLRWNLEANQEVADAAFAGVVASQFETDFSRSVEWTHELWIERPWTDRLAERFWGTIGLWLARIRYPGRY